MDEEPDRGHPSASSAELRRRKKKKKKKKKKPRPVARLNAAIPSGRKQCASGRMPPRVRMQRSARMHSGYGSSAAALWFLPVRSSAPPAATNSNRFTLKTHPIIRMMTSMGTRAGPDDVTKPIPHQSKPIQRLFNGNPNNKPSQNQRSRSQ